MWCLVAQQVWPEAAGVTALESIAEQDILFRLEARDREFHSAYGEGRFRNQVQKLTLSKLLLNPRSFLAL